MESYANNKSLGKLSIVSTPIGNLSDITLRALETLRACDLVVAEDTRRALILLNHFEIKKPVISCHTYNEHKITEKIIGKILGGANVAFLSDAGTPSISDPGYFIVRKAVENGIEPTVIPGVSALTFAAVASGLPMDKFAFYGFLPVKPGRRSTMLKEIAVGGKTAFLFESPHRIGRLLQEICDNIGPETRIAVIREATKLHEEILRGNAREILESCKGKNWKGELTVGICPSSET